MSKIVHKLFIRKYGSLNFCNSLVGSEGSYYWKDVTCKKCLKVGKRK